MSKGSLIAELKASIDEEAASRAKLEEKLTTMVSEHSQDVKSRLEEGACCCNDTSFEWTPSLPLDIICHDVAQLCACFVMTL